MLSLLQILLRMSSCFYQGWKGTFTAIVQEILVILVKSCLKKVGFQLHFRQSSSIRPLHGWLLDNRLHVAWVRYLLSWVIKYKPNEMLHSSIHTVTYVLWIRDLCELLYDMLDEIHSRIDEILVEDGLDLVAYVLDFKEFRTDLI